MVNRTRPPVYTVTAVNHHISSLFLEDAVLSHIYVRGELSNVKYAGSGHLYFSLKDEKSQIRCVMWASAVRSLKNTLKDGDSVIVYGQVSVYERDGTYQLYVTAVRMESGVGRLYEQYEALKARLQEMGMFDPSYKKPIPEYVRTLGVVTASTGAAVRDIINVARRRNPGIQIILYPARVQGDGAADSVAAGIAALDALGCVDVIIAGRGGGSIEDLWAFNEEKVAYAIWNCSTPVISAVGHETDTTIADFVADLRAPTPSAGAELAVADMEDTLLRLQEKRLRMTRLIRHRLDMSRQSAERYALKLQLKGPEGKLREGIHFLAQTSEKMDNLMDRLLKDASVEIDRRKTGLDHGIADKLLRSQQSALLLESRLKALSPQAKLDAGFAYVEGPDGKGIRSVSEVSLGDLMTVRLRDGSVKTRAEEIRSQYGEG